MEIREMWKACTIGSRFEKGVWECVVYDPDDFGYRYHVGLLG
jgi:hypothetical protein